MGKLRMKRLQAGGFLLAAIATILIGCGNFASNQPPRFTARELAVIVNQSDPLSVEIGRYYQQRRQIPAENVIAIAFPPNRTTLSPTEFQQLKQQIDAKTPTHVQGYALTWAAPYRVGCMSITSAFALGFDEQYCADTCKPTQANPYFRQVSSRPQEEFGVRPTMAIAAQDLQRAQELIDRGVASDGTFPQGTAYLLKTSDAARNVRSALYPRIVQQLGQRLPIDVIQGDILQFKWDVLFYFTGLPKVEQIDRNYFFPGAIADHLTSAGGMLTDSFQMSSLRWLEAGATGSYGAVVEPCNFIQKFPHPGIVIDRYLAGDTLLEAYWQSVAWPGQGIFIGEPLARPFGDRQQ
jgi:uncharacterized protein (TIGR03790 family)